MSGMAPITILITGALIAALGVGWLVARLLRAQIVAHYLAISFWSSAAICFSFLFLEKMVNTSYAKGLYAAISVTVAVGLAAGYALRRARN
jgi:hypothetical protein